MLYNRCCYVIRTMKTKTSFPALPTADLYPLTIYALLIFFFFIKIRNLIFCYANVATCNNSSSIFVFFKLCMKVIDHLKGSSETLFSFEILPPLKGANIQSIFNGIDPLMEFNLKFINVTYHREEYLYKEKENGLLEKISMEKTRHCRNLRGNYE